MKKFKEYRKAVDNHFTTMVDVDWNEDGGIPLLVYSLVSNIFPIVGILLFISSRQSHPRRAKYSLIAAVITIILLVITVISVSLSLNKRY